MDFHEVRFPTQISIGSSGGPEYNTELIKLGSGADVRNARWANSLHRYDAGYGIKNLNDLHEVLEFFEARRGRLYGFRWKDRIDFKSCRPQDDVSPLDQQIGTGDGDALTFQLVKNYTSGNVTRTRAIKKPVAGTVRVAVDGVEMTIDVDFAVDTTTGVITFSVAPGVSEVVTAGYEFDVPVRFDTDFLDINQEHQTAGRIPRIPIVELRI